MSKVSKLITITLASFLNDETCVIVLFQNALFLWNV